MRQCEGELTEATMMAGGHVRLTLSSDKDQTVHVSCTVAEAAALLKSTPLGSKVALDCQITMLAEHSEDQHAL